MRNENIHEMRYTHVCSNEKFKEIFIYLPHSYDGYDAGTPASVWSSHQSMKMTTQTQAEHPTHSSSFSSVDSWPSRWAVTPSEFSHRLTEHYDSGAGQIKVDFNNYFLTNLGEWWSPPPWCDEWHPVMWTPAVTHHRAEDNVCLDLIQGLTFWCWRCLKTISVTSFLSWHHYTTDDLSSGDLSFILCPAPDLRVKMNNRERYLLPPARAHHDLWLYLLS